MSIFHHVDRDGDELEVLAGTYLEFHMAGKVGAGIAVHVDRDAALRLHAALGEWLYPVHTPEWANKSLIEQMIEKAVKDQVAAVLPLHLKPGDRFLMADADGRVWADPEPHDVGHAEEPEGVHRPQDCPGQPECAEGPATGPCDALLEPGQRLIEVHDCGYVWAMHKSSAPLPDHGRHSEPYSPPLHLATESECRADSQNPCIAARHLVAEPETNHGRLMSELPVRTRPRPICVSCGHGWGEHTSGICWGEHGTAMQSEPGCTCTRERPGTAGTS